MSEDCHRYGNDDGDDPGRELQEQRARESAEHRQRMEGLCPGNWEPCARGIDWSPRMSEIGADAEDVRDYWCRDFGSGIARADAWFGRLEDSVREFLDAKFLGNAGISPNPDDRPDKQIS